MSNSFKSQCMSLFGIVNYGCESNSTVERIIEEQHEMLNSVVASVVSKSSQFMSNSLSAVQSVSCKSTAGTCSITDVDMSMYVRYTSEDSATLSKNIVDNINLESIVDSAIDINNKHIAASGGTMSVNSTDFFKKRVKQVFKSSIDISRLSEEIQSCTNRLYMEQTVNVHSHGDAIVSGIKMNMVIDATSKCIFGAILNQVSNMNSSQISMSDIKTISLTETSNSLADTVISIGRYIAIAGAFLGIIILR